MLILYFNLFGPAGLFSRIFMYTIQCYRLGVLPAIGMLVISCDLNQGLKSEEDQTAKVLTPQGFTESSSPHDDYPHPFSNKSREVILNRIDTYGAFSRSIQKQVTSRAVRVVLLFSREAVYRFSELSSTNGVPRRLCLDLESVHIDSGIPSVIRVAEGGLHRIRSFKLNDTITRIAFDISNAVQYKFFYLHRPYRIVMDLSIPYPQNTEMRNERAIKTIVLDPGHGGIHSGARSPKGIKESVVALDLARRAAARLRRILPRSHVHLTRNTDRIVSLEERTAIANGYAADLFVSIHLNGTSSKIERGGVSTFILDTSNDKQALRLAAIENGTSERDVSELEKILASLYRKDQVSQSYQLASFIQNETLASGRKVLPNLSDRGVRRALFYVLVGARMPAALVEASFITHFQEAVALETGEYRQMLAEGIARGIYRYLSAKQKRR